MNEKTAEDYANEIADHVRMLDIGAHPFFELVRDSFIAFGNQRYEEGLRNGYKQAERDMYSVDACEKGFEQARREALEEAAEISAPRLFGRDCCRHTALEIKKGIRSLISKEAK